MQATISVNLGQDLSSATGAKMKLKSPSGNTGEFDATINGSSVDFYGDFEAGQWEAEGIAFLPGYNLSSIQNITI